MLALSVEYQKLLKKGIEKNRGYYITLEQEKWINRQLTKEEKKLQQELIQLKMKRSNNPDVLKRKTKIKMRVLQIGIEKKWLFRQKVLCYCIFFLLSATLDF